MDIIRRNTDYGLRAAVVLAEHYDKAISARTISALEEIPYQLTSKLLQKLHKAGFVESIMGPKGGFKLKKAPSEVNLLELTELLQGPLSLNRCMLKSCCPRQASCGISVELKNLQGQIADFFTQKTLDSLIEKQPLHKLIFEMKEIFTGDQKRIDHAFKVLDYAEQIHIKEGGDPFIIKAAAVLHDIGIPISIKKYNSSGGNYQEIEGPPIAKEILAKYNISKECSEHICKIIANHHSAKDIDTPEFRIIWDADWLVNFPGDFANADKEKKKKAVKKIFKTKTGHQLACKLFIN